jgi:phosphoglycerol transferase MdoB-like AlkP superfamily enzyme
MNESFSDLSRLDNLRCDYEGPQFFKSMDDTLRRGQLAVSVYGAGTCNSEFEVLTANSLAFVGAGKYPYQMFDLSETDNLARQFKNMGYNTLAIHPNQGANWNRNVVYRDLGFDRFISCDNDFEGEPGFHNGFTDRVTYDRILKALSDESAPYFIFDVTMQNHGGYQIGNIPADRLTNYQPQGFTAEDLGKLNEFLSCIQASDEDLAWFVGELEKIDRPVVLVFFGDHHPVVSATYNDAFFDVLAEGEMDHQARVYQTDYFIWANYDVEGCEQTSEIEGVGTDCLGALTLDLIGAPLNEFQAAQLGIHTRLPEISSIGYSGTDGHWHAPGTSPYLDPIYQQMAHMDYLRFGEGVR